MGKGEVAYACACGEGGVYICTGICIVCVAYLRAYAGGQADIYLGRWKGVRVAVKQLRARPTDAMAPSVRREVRALPYACIFTRNACAWMGLQGMHLHMSAYMHTCACPCCAGASACPRAAPQRRALVRGVLAAGGACGAAAGRRLAARRALSPARCDLGSGRRGLALRHRARHDRDPRPSHPASRPQGRRCCHTHARTCTCINTLCTQDLKPISNVWVISRH